MTKSLKTKHGWSPERKKKGAFATKLAALLKNISMRDGKKPQKFHISGILKNLFLLSLAGFFFGVIALLIAFAWLSRDLPDPGSLTIREVAQATKIYDRTGEHLLYEIFGDENRTLTKIQEGFCNPETAMEKDVNGIPLIAMQATIAAEDRTFCTHHGFSVKGILRAVIFRGNRGGGSTLTQQLVKNAILTNERSVIRKVKELILSYSLERRYEKDEILQIYFNEIPYGSTYYGIETAAQNYYGKRAGELTLGEAATLAGLPQLPTYFINNPDKLEERRNWILDSMAELSYITEEEADAAKAEPTPLRPRFEGITAPHFVLWIKEQLETEYGQRMVEQGGLKVITTLDYDLQKIGEEAALKNRDAQGERLGFNNSGLIAMNPQNGEILTMVGSVDYFNNDINGKVNVTLRPLQPGSSIKPLIFAAAFEKGYTPNTILWDTETDFTTATGNYRPRNFNLREYGPVSIRKALQGSLNIPAVKALYLVGVNQGIDFLERMGYTTFGDRSNFGLAIVLGGAEVKLLDHVAAYSVFANDGVYHAPKAILKIESPKGEVLFEAPSDAGKEVLDQNVARMVSNVLSDDGARAYVFGTNSLLTLPGRPIAAKTGTTNNYKDAWAIGYTPSLAAGVWTGNTDGTTMAQSAGGSGVAMPVWNEFMRRALEGTPVESFTAPQIPQTGKPILDGQIPVTNVVIDRASGKLATDLTPESFREEKACAELHNILHFVNPSSPAGEIPGEGARDRSYGAWEASVQAYLQKENREPIIINDVEVETCGSITEFDDVHTAENKPSIALFNPRQDETVTRSFNVSLSSSAPRGIHRVEYRINDEVFHVDNNPFGSFIRLPSYVSQGQQTLTVVVYDDVDNSSQASIRINVSEASESSNARITNPFRNQIIDRSNPTYQIVVEGARAGDYQNLRVQARHLFTNITMLVGETNSPTGFDTFDWALPALSGFYTLQGTVTTHSGNTVDLTPVRVNLTQ